VRRAGSRQPAAARCAMPHVMLVDRLAPCPHTQHKQGVQLQGAQVRVRGPAPQEAGALQPQRSAQQAKGCGDSFAPIAPLPPCPPACARRLALELTARPSALRQPRQPPRALLPALTPLPSGALLPPQLVNVTGRRCAPRPTGGRCVRQSVGRCMVLRPGAPAPWGKGQWGQAAGRGAAGRRFACSQGEVVIMALGPHRPTHPPPFPPSAPSAARGRARRGPLAAAPAPRGGSSSRGPPTRWGGAAAARNGAPNPAQAHY
jgi:hypothetical protein